MIIKARSISYSILKYFVLILFAVFCLYPIYWVFISSFKSNSELFSNVWGLPQEFILTNYIRSIFEKRIDIAFINSVIITAGAMFFNIATGSMAAYATTRMIWKFSGFVKSLFIVGMMLPTYAAIVPLFSMFITLGINNTHLAVILANIAFGLPMTIFILSGFYSTLPRELEEAAVIDGCGVLRTFFRIILPISIAPTATVSVISFLNAWNDLLFPQIFLSNRDRMPLPVILTMFRDEFTTDYVGLLAAVVITLIPTIFVYIIFHSKIIDGMTAGAVKG